MKKIFALALAAVMTAGMATTAFAADAYLQLGESGQVEPRLTELATPVCPCPAMGQNRKTKKRSSRCGRAVFSASGPAFHEKLSTMCRTQPEKSQKNAGKMTK